MAVDKYFAIWRALTPHPKLNQADPQLGWADRLKNKQMNKGVVAKGLLARPGRLSIGVGLGLVWLGLVWLGWVCWVGLGLLGWVGFVGLGLLGWVCWVGFVGLGLPGWVGLGQVRSGQVRSGQVRSGQVRLVRLG